MDINILQENKSIIPLIESAIQAALPEQYLNEVRLSNKYLNYKDLLIDFENIYLIAVGKAAPSMSKPFLNYKFKKRIIISNESYGLNDVIISSHPFSNENGYFGAKEIENLLKNTKENDLVLFLLSGGASSLLADYVIPIDIVNSLFSDLMKNGADIFDLNTVRKHLSFLKGGRMAKITKSKILSLIISDVMRDDLSIIGSGPTYYDNSSFIDAIEVIKKFKLDKKYEKIIEILNNPAKYSLLETIKKNEFPSWRVWNKIICNNEKSLKAVEKKGNEMGFNVLNIGTTVSGEAKIVSKEIYRKFEDLENNSVLVSGGETVVTVKGKGKGGRNQEFVLSLLGEIKENEVIASFGTDGIDGPTDAAGAAADFSTKSTMDEIKNYLENNDSYNFFKKKGTLIFTGPTGTNVMDVQIFMKK
ncbi:MAG: glycerate kinase type-2 family protein [Thermoplasmata archaeon]